VPTPHPPRPSVPPPGAAPQESDESLAARLGGTTDAEAARCAARLITRHWHPVHTYATICLASTAEISSMVTTAAFHQVLDRLALGEPGVALRPRLLVAVRDTVRQWASDEQIAADLPELRKPAGGRGLRTAALPAPDHRRLARRAFAQLSPVARCLLWHTEVEAEPPAVPAGLLGMDLDTALLALEQARERFREGCVRAHRDLAPSDDCRFHNRLLDLATRRGGPLPPDIRRHLAACRYCRDAAGQLRSAEREVGTLLAEAVLGWGARRYLDSRPGRARRATGTAGPALRRRRAARHGGRRSAPGLGPLSRIPYSRVLFCRFPFSRVPPPGRPEQAARTAAGLVLAGLLATLLGVALWPSGGGDTAPAASPGASGTPATVPGAGRPSTPAPARSGTPAPPPGPGQARLRNVATGLCLDIRGEPGPGADARLAACSAAPTQQWTLEADGLLRSSADPGLCLDSHADAGVVVLGTCAGGDTRRGPDVRYDLTVRGELLPRWDERLALTFTTAAPDAAVVTKVRDRSTAQQWATDAASPAPLSIAGAGTRPGRPPAQPETHRPSGPPETLT
jgi:hypothetical protein